MALSFIKKWFSKSSVFENLKRWHDSPLRRGTVSRKRRNSRRAGAVRLGLEMLEIRDVPAAVPAVILSVDPTPFIGSLNEPVSITFTNATANGSTQPGYGPWVYAIIPASGTAVNSLNDGVSYVANSATFLGAPLSEDVFTVPAGGSVTGPSYAQNTAGDPITLSGLTPNDQVVFFQLPYISFAPDQPNATITFNTNVSTFADLGVPLTITAGGGFGLGEDPLDNPGTDTPLLATNVTSAVAPQLIRVTKTYIGPEQETATGPNFVRQYRVDARVAPGQTITAFQIVDLLSDGMQFVPGTITGSASGGTFTGFAGTTATAATPGGTIIGNFDQIMGDGSASSVDATMTFDFFVPRNYAPATGGEIVPLANGDFEDLTNTASGAGNWDPLDPLDATITSTDAFWSSPSARDTDIITAKSIATQKGVTVVGGGPVQQGAVLEYTINFQISDYFAFDQLNIPDLLPDGVRFQASFTPTLSVTQHSGLNHSGNFAPANYAVQAGFNADGTQTLRFDVSNELGGTGRLIGGWIPPAGTGGPQPSQPNGNTTPATFTPGTTGQIVFRAVIQPAYDVRQSPNSNKDIKQGDDLLNVVPDTNVSGNLTQTPGGRVLNFDDLTPTTFLQADNTSALVELATGSITKSIYAINGQIYNSAVPPNLQAGDSVTFRITYVLPTSTVENFVITDYLPLPVFDATTVTTFTPGGPSATIPAAGTAKFGPGIASPPTGVTLPGGTVNYSTVFAAPANNPTVAGPNDGTNRVILTFPPNLEDTLQRTSFIDVLFTVTIEDEPFADGYPLTNQANAREGNTQAAQTQSDVILPVTLTRPVLDIVKGVVATDGVSFTFTPTLTGQTAFNAPGTAGARFAGTISSATLAANPINSNLSGIDAGDRVSFAVIVENTGTGPRGAFDVLINDTIPTGFVLAGGGNLRVVDGTGAVVPFTVVGGGLFGTGVGDGIRLNDPGATPAQLDRTDAGAIDSVDTPTPGRNVIVITYDLIAEAPPAANAVSSNVLYTNTARVVSYSAEEGGTDYAPSNPPTSLLTDPATVRVENPTIAKTLVSTSFSNAFNTDNAPTSAQAVIGEEITYRVVVTYPEGITPGASIVDLLDTGLVFVAVDSVTPTGGLTLQNTLAVGGPSANVTVSGQTITFNTGTVTNTNTDNAAQTLTIVYRVRVANVAASQQGQNKNNQADVRFTGQPGTAIRSSAGQTRILEPIVSTVKDVRVGGVLNGTGDAGDLVSYTVTLFNPAQTLTTGGNFTTVAYDVTLNDPLPTADVTFSPTIVYTGPARYSASDFIISAGVLQTVIGTPLPDLLPGETITLTVGGVINTTVTTGQTVFNTATTRFTSLPAGNPTEAFERDGSGGVNDYVTQDPGDFIISTPNPNKSIVLTSETSTAINSLTQADVAIGEVVRYHVAVRIPQTAGLVNFRISDVLPAGLLFLNDDTARVALVSSGGTGLTSSLIPAGAQFNGTLPDVTPTFTFPSAQISNGTNPGNPFADGDDPLFSFGTVTNTNSSTTTDEYVVLEFNALVLNSASNVAGVNLDNFFTVQINGIPDLTSTPAARVTIVEPDVEVAKVALNLTTGTTTGDAGDEVEYTITLTNTGGATAFNTVFGDTLPPELGSPTIFSVSGSSLGIGDFTISPGGVISTNNAPTGFTIPSTPGNNTVVIVVRGTLTEAVTPAQSIPNTADVTYTSLPGDNGTTGNTTGSDTPGLPGDPTGERTGTGIGLNNYLDSDSATIDVPNGSVVKSLDSTSLPDTDTSGANVAIGETITYALTVTLPEGTTSSLNLTDVLPAGVTFVAGSVVVDTTGFVGSGVSANPTVAVGAGNTLTIDFAGPIVVTGDNNTGNNSFVVTYTVQVVDVPGNVGILPATQTTLVNAVTMTAGTSPPVTAPPVTATVVEPELQIDKTVVTVDTSIDAGTSIDYQLVISHTNNSTGPAYSLVITDALLPIGMTLDTGSIVVTPSDGTTVVGAITFDANGVSITVDKLLPGETITVTYSATLNGPAVTGTVPLPGSTVINTATTTYNTHPTPGGRPEGPISDTAQITVNEYSISGEIYYDANNSGTRQAGTEPLITESVDLRLIGTDAEGNPVDVSLNTTTGQYTFDGLRPGTYRVIEVATPASYLDGIDTAGTPFGGTGDTPSTTGKTDPTLGAVGGTITSIVIPVNADQDGVANTGIDYNFGELLPASIGDFVWLDANNNGVQDGGGEVGINNVLVTLTGTDDLGAVSITDTTDSLGAYSFTNLRPGTYVVTFGDSDGTTTYFRTVQNAVAATPATDSDADPTTGATAAITLAAGEVNEDIDQGLFLQADLQITKDDGVTTYTAGTTTTYTIVVTNAGPSFVTGATVTDTFDFTRFTNVSWTAVAGTGAAAGATGFTASGTGNILDTVNMPVGSTITYTVIGTINSAATGVLSNTATVTAPFGTVDPTPQNNTDTDDDDPNPVADLSITKTDGVTTYRRNQPLTYTIVVTNSGPSDVQDATVTDNFPAAFFPAGITWSVSSQTGGATSSFGVGVDQTGNIADTVDMPAGSTITYTATGIVASNASGPLINTATVSIPPGDLTPLNNTATDRDNPPGGTPPPPPLASIAGTVYQDLNDDGIKQATEPGIGGATVTLFNSATGVVVGTRTTLADGTYSFTGLAAGTYLITETQPAGFADGKDMAGTSGGVLQAPDSINSISLNAGVAATGYNFGEIGSGVGISGTVFFDANKDGDLEAGEVGIPVVTITLTNSSGVVVGTTTTDANGNYSFPSVAPGTYTITETQPTGYGDPPSGPFAPNTRTVTVVSTPVIDQNFGDTLGGLSGLVYQDLNDDGIHQPTEPVIPGVTVTLFSGTTTVGTTTTAADGTYNFTALPAGDYRVVETQPAGFTDGKDTVGSVGGTLVAPDTISSIPLPAGVLGTGYNFGELFQGISGKVFLDVNKDGDLQSGEVGIPGVTITLTNSAGAVVGTTTTDANGNYSFPNVPPGTYTITETQPAAYGNPPSGPFAPNTRTVTLAAGTSSINQNFGDTPGGLSGLVYQDLNDDGIRQPAEPGIPGVTVTLFSGDTIVGTTTTSADGTYNFNQLPAGTYRVVETQPAGFTDGKDTAGSVGGQLVPTDTITNITLPAGVLATGYNFGELTTTNRLSGTVYLDVNQDSIYQPGSDSPLQGITITLRNTSGAVVAVTTTAADGTYSFSDLPAGRYTITETQPTGHGSSQIPFNVRTVTMPATGNVTNQNFGDTLGNISGRVYRDYNLNGFFTPTGANPDTGIPGITVTLRNAAGVVVATTVTSANGMYRFNNILPGRYTVTETQPPLPISLTQGFYDGADNLGTLGGTRPVKNTLSLVLGINPTTQISQNARSYNFGELPPADPNGFVFVDANRNGIRDPGERGIAGVAITISGTAFFGTPFARPIVGADVPGGSLTVFTNANGFYEFNPIPPGLYAIRERQPVGFIDGLEQNGDPSAPAPIVGNDVFSNILLNPFPIRGPFNFGEFLPTTGPVGMDPTKRALLGSAM